MHRHRLALLWRELMHVGREKIFGANAADFMPTGLRADAALMQPGLVGPRYRENGLVILSRNPGGGHFKSRTPDDARFYPTLERLKDTVGDDAMLDAFEEMNRVGLEVHPEWTTSYVASQIRRTLAVDHQQVAYLRAVPYRTRDNRPPHKQHYAAAFRFVTGPELDALRPAVIVAILKPAYEAMLAHYKGQAIVHYVPMARGDHYLHTKAGPALEKLKRDLSGKIASLP